MKPYLLSVALGLLVGVIYSLSGVRSPAPPVIALVGLLGILVGEQLPPLVKQWFKPDVVARSWLQHQVRPHMFGHLPQCAPPGSSPTTTTTTTTASTTAPTAATKAASTLAPAGDQHHG